MKKIFCLVLLALTLSFAAPFPAAAQQNKQLCDAFVAEISKQLPMDTGEGIIWTRVAVEDNYSLLVMTLEVTGTEDVSSQDLKKYLETATPAEIKKMFYDEFEETLKILGTKCRIVFVFADGSRHPFTFD